MKILSYILFLIPVILISGNSFSQQVIATAGGSASGTGIELSWTIGEPVTATAQGTDFYLTQGFQQSNPFSSMYYQKLSFTTGWNIMSANLIPENKNLLDIFQPFINHTSLIKIQDELGNSLEDWGIFGGWQNNIGDIELAEGYKIKVSKKDSLEISGTPANFPFAIPLKRGWNIAGYPQQTGYDGMNLIQQLIDKNTLEKVQDEKGNSIEDWGIFGGWTNNIGDFIPGEGYKVKVNASDTLWIYESYPKSSVILQQQIATTHFQIAFKGNGVDHMNINLVGLPINVLRAGDELAIFDGATCVGAVKVMPHHIKNQTISIAASATDEQGMKGFKEGNTFTLKLWHSQQKTEFVLEPEIVEGNSTFTKYETTFASLEKYAVTGLEGLITSELPPEINCYPNPFSDEVTIEINLLNDSEVSVEVLNQLGQQVKFVTTKQLFNSGVHKLSWNGRNANNNQLSPGIYLLRIEMYNSVIHKKIVLAK